MNTISSRPLTAPKSLRRLRAAIERCERANQGYDRADLAIQGAFSDATSTPAEREYWDARVDTELSCMDDAEQSLVDTVIELTGPGPDDDSRPVAKVIRIDGKIV